jgi:hypothetical protein
MPSTPERGGRRPSADRPKGAALGPTITRRGLFHAAALAGLGIATLPARDALAWSSWTNVSSTFLKSIGMGDCVHEDLVQISYARALARIQYDQSHEDALINPWMGRIQENGTVKIAGDTVSVGGGKSFKSDEDLASRLYRENLVCLRIGSFWNDAAANTLMDFGASCSI